MESKKELNLVLNNYSLLEDLFLKGPLPINKFFRSTLEVPLEEGLIEIKNDMVSLTPYGEELFMEFSRDWIETEELINYLERELEKGFEVVISKVNPYAKWFEGEVILKSGEIIKVSGKFSSQPEVILVENMVFISKKGEKKNIQGSQNYYSLILKIEPKIREALLQFRRKVSE